MRFLCAFDERFLLVQLSASENSEHLVEAYEMFQNGYEQGDHNLIDNAHKRIQEFVSKEDPIAMVLSATFSKRDESEDAFLSRHLDLLMAASRLENSLALFSLAAYYDSGSLLPENKEQALILYKKAAELGMVQAQSAYGIMQFYGTGGATQNRESGLSLVSQAADAGVDQAIEFLNSIANE